MLSDNGNEPVDTCGTVLIGEGVWEIIQLGKFPKQTENSTPMACGFKLEVNNVCLRSKRCPERKCWTQLRFCYSAGEK
jgi:hypothetical protein